MSESAKGAEGCATRGLTEVFLIGHPDSSLGLPHKLPVARKILQYLKYLQSQPGMKSVPVKSLVSCPLMKKSHTAACSGPTGCSSPSSGRSRCVVAGVREFWNKSGIPRISDYAISNKVLSLYNEWHGLNKNKMKTSCVDIEKRKRFEEKLNMLFDIASPDAIQILESDRLRSLDARQADIDFYLDQKGPRIGSMGALDKVHQKAVESKKKRLEESELQQEKTSSSSQPDKKKLPLSEMGDIEDDIDDTDFIPSVQKAKKAYSVPLLVPRNITKAVALNSKRWKISDVATASKSGFNYQEVWW